MQNDEPLVTLTFKGERFADHGLDLEVLPELVAYQRIVSETAKELWRVHHPERQRLPKNIDEDFTLKIFSLEEGSVRVPLRRHPRPSLFVMESELDEAVELITATIDNVEKGLSMPDNLPKNVIPLFANCGKTLRDDEFIEQKSRAGKQANFSKLVREHFEQLLSGDYRDEFDIVGSVVMARVDKPRLAIMDDNKNEIEAPFEEDDIAIILQALENHASVRVRIAGCGIFTPGGELKKVDQLDVIEIVGAESANPLLDNTIPIWEQLIQSADAMSAEMKSRLPHDAAAKVDQYLYGKNP